MPLIKDSVKKSSVVMTDEFVIYQNLTSSGYEHQTVNHGSKQYVEGIKHTNTIEGFWSQLKRSVNGTYHAVSRSIYRLTLMNLLIITIRGSLRVLYFWDWLRSFFK